MTVKKAFNAAKTTVAGMKELGFQTIAAKDINYSGENHRKLALRH